MRSRGQCQEDCALFYRDHAEETYCASGLLIAKTGGHCYLLETERFAHRTVASGCVLIARADGHVFGRANGTRAFYKYANRSGTCMSY